MIVIMRAFVWDFSLDNAASVFKTLQDEWGIDGISFVVNNPTNALLLPNAYERRLCFLDEGAVCFLPQRSWYVDLPVVPIASEQCSGRNWLKELGEQAKAAGLTVNAVVSCCRNPAIGKRCPELTVCNALKERLVHALCPANPTVRQLLVSTIGDLVTNYPLDAVELEDLGYMNLSKVTGLVSDIQLTPTVDFMLSHCFCEHCYSVAKEQGVEIERICFFFQTELEQFFIVPTDLAQMPLEWESWGALVDNEGRKVIHLRMDIVSSLLALLVEEASYKHGKRVHIEGRLLPATLWQQGLDYQRLGQLVNAVEVDAKDVPPERLPPYLLLNKQVLGSQVELWVRLHLSERFIPNRQAFLAQARACKEQGVRGVVIVGYGSLRRQHWEWIREAIALLKA